MGVIWGKREGEYFWGEDWTGEIRLIQLRKLVFWRNGCVVEKGDLDSEGARCRRVHPLMRQAADSRTRTRLPVASA
jgi:hypothetical protein